jgi:hypothetical protein
MSALLFDMFELSAKLSANERVIDDMNELIMAFASTANVAGASAWPVIYSDALNETRLLSM